MSRYQCPFCQSLHRREESPRCPAHGLGYSPHCTTCVQTARQIPCGGTQ